MTRFFIFGVGKNTLDFWLTEYVFNAIGQQNLSLNVILKENS